MAELEISWLSPDGEGGGRGPHGNLRVAGAIPGDVVEIPEVEKGQKSAPLLRLVRPSPHRQAPPCPLDGVCGGCDLSTWAAPQRVEGLQTLVQRAFGLEAPPAWVPSPRPRGYRARIQLSIQAGKAGYRGRRSTDFVEAPHCGIARPEVNLALAQLQAWLSTHDAQGLDRVELRSDGVAVAYAFSSAGSVPRAVRDSLFLLGDVALDGSALHGDPTRYIPLGELSLKASPKTFYQVNLEVNALLVEHVVNEVMARNPERIVDVYAGHGNLTLQFALLGIPVTAVELEGAALADLRSVAGKAPVQTLARAAERVEWRRIPYDVAVLDPPRAGTKGALAALLVNRPRAFVYVSCDPVSGSRDLREAEKQGYSMVSIRCFDMFPDTHHVETVFVAERK